MINVLYVCPWSGIGGAETFILQTQSQTQVDLYKNHYLLFNQGPLYDSLQKRGARVYLLNSIPNLLRIGDHKKVQSELKKIMNEQNIHLVHSTMASAALFTAWTCKQMGVPHIWFQHGPVSGWRDRLAALFPHNGLIVNSHYTGKKQRELENPFRFLIPRKLPIEKILLGTEIKPASPEAITTFMDKLFSELNLSAETLIISMLCRLEKRKGVMLLLQALDQIQRESLAKPIFCMIWGDSAKDEEYKNSLQQFIKEKNLPAKLMGVSPNVTLPLHISNIIVNSSLQPESFGQSIIEAMTLGSIPVVPDEGGPIEIVTNGKDGLTFKARQPQSLARTLKSLILDAELRKKLSAETMETARNKYQAKRAIAQLETFYQKVLNQ